MPGSNSSGGWPIAAGTFWSSGVRTSLIWDSDSGSHFLIIDSSPNSFSLLTRSFSTTCQTLVSDIPNLAISAVFSPS